MLVTMVDIRIAPATCAHVDKVFRMRVHDGIPLEGRAHVGNLTCVLLGRGEIKKVIVAPEQRCEMRVHGYLLVAIFVIGDWRSIKQDHVPVIDPEVVVEHASYDPVARTQALDPDGLFKTG